MNPNLCRVVLRERGPLEVFDLAVRLLRAHPGPALRLLLATVALPALGFSVAAWLTDGHWALLPATLPLFPLLQAPATLLGGRLLFSDQVRVRDALREVARRPIALGVATLQRGVASLAGLVAFGVGLPFAMAATAWLTEAALLERVDASRGLRRSLRLSGANPGVAAAAVAGQLGLTAWGALVGETAGQGLVGFVLQLGEPFGSVTGGRVTPYLLAGVLAAQPLIALYRLLLYVDLRTRVEGWDLQVGLRAAGLGARR